VNHGDRLGKFWQRLQFSKLIEVPVIATPFSEQTSVDLVFTDIDPTELARQLTLREQQYSHCLLLYFMEFLDLMFQVLPCYQHERVLQACLDQE